MIRSVALPLLPGNCFDRNVGKTKFHKSQHFEHCKRIPMLSEKVKPGIGGVPLPGTRLARKYPSIFARGEVTDLPPWIMFDKQVLCFDAYFQETAQERNLYAYQVRKCKIYFYLEDGTVQVSEPKVDNSGIPQGTLISRQRIPFPGHRNADFYDIIDFNIGHQLELYGRNFKIVNCDKFTRVFLNRLGIHVPDPVCSPPDPYEVHREKMTASMAARKPNLTLDTLGQFLEHDRHVLRFFGYWDDRETEGGFLHHLVLHYFLADDTIEVKEDIPENSGRDSGFMFCRRGKLPKYFSELPVLGAESSFTVLNVLGEHFSKVRYVADPLNCGLVKTESYKENDLAIGAVINCYGRKIVLTDCDPFTKEFYRVKYGVDNFTPAEHPKAMEEILPEKKERELPPYNGYGTFEDSASNCRTMVPVPPQRDFKKFFNKDRHGYNSHVLRFQARMISKIQENNTRHFIISYFLCDDTMSVYENVVPNLGFIGGEFFRRGKMYKPGQELYANKKPDTYTQEDLFVGNTLVLNEFVFMLMDADDYAFRYMELNCHEFPKSNICLILEKLRVVLRPIYKDFVSQYLQSDNCVCGIVPYCKLRKSIKEIIGDGMTEHEIVTIARHYNARCKEAPIDREGLRSIVHTELKRFIYNEFDRLEESLRHMDPMRTCYIDRDKAYAICRAARLPIDKYLLEKVLDMIVKNECGQLHYMDLLQFLDYKACSSSVALPLNTINTFSPSRDIPSPPIGLINFEALLKDLKLEDTVTKQG